MKGEARSAKEGGQRGAPTTSSSVLFFLSLVSFVPPSIHLKRREKQCLYRMCSASRFRRKRCTPSTTEQPFCHLGRVAANGGCRSNRHIPWRPTSLRRCIQKDHQGAEDSAEGQRRRTRKREGEEKAWIRAFLLLLLVFNFFQAVPMAANSRTQRYYADERGMLRCIEKRQERVQSICGPSNCSSIFFLSFSWWPYRREVCQQLSLILSPPSSPARSVYRWEADETVAKAAGGPGGIELSG